MRKKLTAILLSCALLGALAVPAMASAAELPDSVLYYGTVQEIVTGEDGTVERLWLTSEADGEYVMNLSDSTVWIDSGNRTADDPSDLQVGEAVYVYHSPVSTASLPPQSPAYAVVRNMPQDAGCPRYLTVEAVTEADGVVRITAENGALTVLVDDSAEITTYAGGTATAADVTVGSRLMVWDNDSGDEIRADALMLLDAAAESEPLTRAAFVSMLHEAAGSPVVNYAMEYSDVDQGADYAEAVRWATSEGHVAGYDDGTFRPDETLSRQQLATILWRYSGSPEASEDDLAAYADGNAVAPYARQAVAWACREGLLRADADGMLHPADAATAADAAAALRSLGA